VLLLPQNVTKTSSLHNGQKLSAYICSKSPVYMEAGLARLRGGPLEKWWGGGGGGGAKIKIEQGKQKKIHAPKNSCRDFSIGKIISLQGISEGGAEGTICPRPQCKGGPQIWKIKKKKFGTFFDICNGVRTNYLNLNLADTDAKKDFKHVLIRICQGKFYFELTDVSRENFLTL
jgi:hypothetical protein